jgi:hypothetical protein
MRTKRLRVGMKALVPPKKALPIRCATVVSRAFMLLIVAIVMFSRRWFS